MRCVLNRLLRGICVFAFALAALSSAKAQSDFKGFYLGGNVGNAMGRFSVDTSPTFSPIGYFAATSTTAITAASSQQIKPNGITGGGQAGYNYQWDNLVLGVEVDVDRMDLSGSTTVTQPYPCCPPSTFTVTQNAETSWLFTARPKLGVVFGRMMFYGTAGVTASRVKYSELFTDTFATANESAIFQQKKAGWAGGAGGEFRLTHHLSVKGEYLYIGIPTASTTSTKLTAFTGTAFPTNIFTHTVALHAHIARGGVNFRF